MAIGDIAQAAGYPLVPGNGDDGLVRLGAQEINRTRDFIASLSQLVPGGKPAFRTSAGISSGTSDPSSSAGADGDIYFKIIS